MNVQRKLTTAHQMAYALTWTIHLNVNANQVLQEMGTHALVSLHKACRNCQQLIRIFSIVLCFAFIKIA